MKRNQQLSVVLRELKRSGRQPSVREGRHIKITWVGLDGRTQTLIASKTSASARGVANARATVRRMLAQEIGASS